MRRRKRYRAEQNTKLIPTNLNEKSMRKAWRKLGRRKPRANSNGIRGKPIMVRRSPRRKSDKGEEERVAILERIHSLKEGRKEKRRRKMIKIRI